MAQPQSRTTGGAGVTGSYGLMPGAAGGDGSHSHISRTTGGAGVTGSYGPNDTSSSKSEQQPAPVTTTNESSQGGSSSPAPAADDNMRVPGDPRAAIALTEPLHHSKL